ncbi:hypothetical protein GM3708_3532 (plasmid) [Geminocystis sp. NIES-3708]|uniref:hypothetical protein n=1 Tax=Geminocystis sp. NIES-3708 TaxID=1615909 RepID=UPI0005FCA6A4|nr:hypothetical protein [Geminocystis sp. NIES-3708]BAQ63126.1 hypothetical protein GM3708_3532 [Geminocystis sp. NIES-3708]
MTNGFGDDSIPIPYSKQQNEQDNNHPKKILSPNIKEIEKEAIIEKEKLQIELEKFRYQVLEIQNQLSISNNRNNELETQLNNVNQYNIQLKTELSEAKAEIEKFKKEQKNKSPGDIFDCF